MDTKSKMKNLITILFTLFIFISGAQDYSPESWLYACSYFRENENQKWVVSETSLGTNFVLGLNLYFYCDNFDLLVPMK